MSDLDEKEDRPRPVFSVEEAVLKKLLTDTVLIASLAAAKELGVELFLVGGTLRDLALSRPLKKDFDLLVSGKAWEFTKVLSIALEGSPFVLDEDRAAFRVALTGEGALREPSPVDISLLKDGDIRLDLASRDFTVNAMAVDLKGLLAGKPQLIDPSGGYKDAKNRLLRLVSGGAITEDPIRALRAVRIALSCGLTIEPEAQEAIRAGGEGLKAVSPERKRDELIAIFGCADSSSGLSMLVELFLIDEVLPGVSGWRSVRDPDGTVDYDLLAHTLKTVKEGEGLIDEISGRGIFSRLAPLLNERTGGVDNLVLFKFASFCHDAGKPAAISRESGKLRFIGHENRGFEIVKEWMRALRFSKKSTVLVSALTKGHHRTFEFAALEGPTKRARFRFFASADSRGGEGTGLFQLMLALADARATRGSEDQKLRAECEAMIGFYFDLYLGADKAPLLNGSEIIETLGIGEGPLVGEVIRMLKEAEAMGKVSSREDALLFISDWKGSKGK